MTSSTASTTFDTTRTQALQPFLRIELRDPAHWVALTVEPADRETMTVTGPPDILDRVRATVDGDTLHITLGGGIGDHVRDALTTSLTRRHLAYRIGARSLLEIRIQGFVRVSADAFGADAPAVTVLRPRPPDIPIFGVGP